MKCFLALEIPEVAKVNLDLALAGVIRNSPPARWIPAENRHLTLVFLGAVARSALEALHEALAAVCAAGRPMRLAFGQGGVFPAGKPARVVWVGFRPSAALSRLREGAAQACAELGFSLEPRPYLPHLTLARCRPAWPAAAGDAWRRQTRRSLALAGEIRSFGVDRVSLFESQTRPEGVRYRVVQSYPLGRESRRPERPRDHNR